MANPAALSVMWSPQRDIKEEQRVRVSTVLGSIKRNVGKHGDWASGSGGIGRTSVVSVPNVEIPLAITIPCFLYTDDITHGTDMTAEDGVIGLKEGESLPTNIKLLF